MTRRGHALRSEYAAKEYLLLAAAQYAGDPTVEALAALGRAADRWRRAAEAVLNEILDECEGTDRLTGEQSATVDRLVPRLRIVRDK